VSRGAFLHAKPLALLAASAVRSGLGGATDYACTGMLFIWLPFGGFAHLAGTVGDGRLGVAASIPSVSARVG
jgi:hypothetical protein